MDQISIKTEPRGVTGKKVKVMRRQGTTPVHVFGRGIESLALQCEAGDLRQTLSAAGMTQLINLSVKGEKKPRAVMVRHVQFAPVTRALLHVDFYQVQMEQEIRVDVPIELVGEAPALRHKENSLIQELNSLAIRALPAHIPASLQVDLSPVEDADSVIRVEDIQVGEGITVINDPHQTVARIEVATTMVEETEEAAEEAGGESAEASE